MGRGKKVSLCLRVVTVCADPDDAQNRRRREAINQSSQRDRVLPPVEHDGRNSHNQRGQRGLLLRLRRLQARPRGLSVRGFPLTPQCVTEAYHVARVQPTKNHIAQEYVFPDYAGNRPGRIRRPGEPLDEAEQTLTMNNERFTVPEILFHPTDIGEYQSLRIRRARIHADSQTRRAPL